MVIENTTPGRGYALPAPSNRLADDVFRLISALSALDVDLMAVLSSLADKAATEHSHTIADVVGLLAALAGLSPTTHNHTLASLNGVSISSPANGQVLVFAGGVWSNRALLIGDITNLSATLTTLSDQIATIDGGAF